MTGKMLRPFDHAPVTLKGAYYHTLEQELSGDYPEPSHVHSRIEIRPWWERIWFRFVLRREWPYWEQKNVKHKCSGKLGPGGPITFRTEREDMCVCITAWRQWLCLEPSVQDSDDYGEIIRYAAVRIPEIEIYKAEYLGP